MDFIKLTSLVLAATLAASVLTGCDTRQPTGTGTATPVPTLEITDTDIEPLEAAAADTETTGEAPDLSAADYAAESLEQPWETPEGSISVVDEMIPAALNEFQALKDIGLIAQSVSFNVDYWMQIEEDLMLFPRSDPKYDTQFAYNPYSGKLTKIYLTAYADEDDTPVRTETWDGVEYSFYDNFDDLIDTSITLDGFCKKLAQYYGYAGYTITGVQDLSFNRNPQEIPSGDTFLVDIPAGIDGGACEIFVLLESDGTCMQRCISIGESADCVQLFILESGGVG